LVEETGENHRPDTIRSLDLSHNVLSSTHSLSEIRTHNEAHLEIDKVCSVIKESCIVINLTKGYAVPASYKTPACYPYASR
jgi:hypothetical protein